ncbi:hypothetical protein [Rhodococcus sp. IEGM 1408]|uniref:hypothetical protein n=1 Tax=Rhodococcus sp. IEGM 1408 TaxID=3082220 RepID=UPI002953B51A|nr:hypothetical protein [Rhodococcus sp. IEGM 1408]MDV8002419.1 hypothetical protein [Rhodococcus sp. IEGM 1408]
MDFTGSIADATAPLSAELGSLAQGVGSSAVDTVLRFALSLPTMLLNLAAGIGGDLGSTTGA